MNKQIRFGNALLSIRKIMKDCGQKFFLMDGTLLGWSLGTTDGESLGAQDGVLLG